MKKIFYMAIIFLAIFSVLACSSTGGSVKSQKPGGQVIIYTSMYEDVIAAMKQVIAKELPDYDVQFVYGGTGTLQSRVTTEQASGRIGCDILMVAEPAYSMQLKAMGLLQPYQSKEAANLAFDYDQDGYWYPVRVSNMVLAYNPDKYSKDQVPQSFYDFANDPGVKGAIAMRNPLVSGTTMATITALKDKYGYGYFDALGKQDIQIEYGSDGLINKLQTGEYKEIMILEESILKLQQQNNSKLQVIYPTDGTIVIPSTIMIINDQWSADRNLKGAEAVTDWFLSADGQDSVVVNGWMHSVLTNFAKIPFGSNPISQIIANSMPINWNNDVQQEKDIQNRFQDALAQRQ